MKMFNVTFKIFALLASTVPVRVRGQCVLPTSVATFITIPGFENIGAFYCSLPADTQIFLEVALDSALIKESTSPSFIATCGWQILPNFQNYLASTSYTECPPPGEEAPLSYLTEKIEPSYRLNNGDIFSLIEEVGGNGAWCLNFDICKQDDYSDYMATVTAIFNQNDPFFEGTYITAFYGPSVSCFAGLNPLLCSGDGQVSGCDNTVLLDVTIGSDEPFPVAVCDNECHASDSDLLDLASYFLGRSQRDPFCLFERTPLSAEYSSKDFQVETYCETEAMEDRYGYCCRDTSLKFKFTKDGKELTRGCAYVGKATKKRCALDDIANTCALTCGTCEPCVDTTLQFKIPINGKDRLKTCDFVARKATRKRCSISGVRNACRKTCGGC